MKQRLQYTVKISEEEERQEPPVDDGEPLATKPPLSEEVPLAYDHLTVQGTSKKKNQSNLFNRLYPFQKIDNTAVYTSNDHNTDRENMQTLMLSYLSDRFRFAF